MPRSEDTPGGDTFFARLIRDDWNGSVVIANGQHTSGILDMRRYTMGVVHMPAAWTAASIGFKVARYRTDGFLPFYDEDGNLVQIDAPAVGGSYELPAKLAGARFVRLWSQDGDGVNTVQGAARGIGISLKA